MFCAATPKTPPKSRITLSITPRESFNRGAFSDMSYGQKKNLTSSSTTTVTTATLQDDLIDKNSMEDNDEVLEEMIEEESINFLQQHQ